MEALAQAHRIRQLASSNPMDRLAILRFLLALVYWCKGNPPDGQDSVSSFPSDWFKRLNSCSEHFDLLSGEKRFYQYKRSATEKKLSANYLVQEVPTGTNCWHFRHSIDGFDGLCMACCAVGLLRLPIFATSGGRGKPPGVNSKPPIYAVPLGRSLAETLRLSWGSVSEEDLGTPAWERPEFRLPTVGNIPVLAGLTWLPRRVWLDDPGEPKANCASCGRKGLLVRRMVFAPIGSMKNETSDVSRSWSDPHTIHDGNDVLKPGNALDASDAGAGQWTRTAAGALEKHQGVCDVWSVGFATVQNDKYLEAMEFIIPDISFPDAQDIQERVARIKRWEQGADRLARRVAHAAPQ